MSKSRFVIDKFAKLFEQGLLTSKDLGNEIINILKSQRDEIVFKMKLTSKDETDILNKRVEKLEKKVIALMPLNDMDLLITNFSRPFFDFCLPPHDVNEIFLRLINITGKSGNENKQLIISGPLIIDQESYEVTLDGEKVDLTFKEYELLRYLAAKPGRVFSRESLLHSVWEYDYYGGTRTVDVHVRRLRSKINDIRYNFIETVWNVGYRFKSVKAKNI
mgnify:CR=1 FL=1